MLSRIDYNGIAWVDVQSPSPDEISKLTKEFNLPQHVSEELARPSFHPKAESWGEQLYLIFHLPLYDHRRGHHHSRELDLAVGGKFILTIHYEPIEPLADFFGKTELNLNLRQNLFDKSAQKLLHRLWHEIYRHLLAELDHIQRKIDRVEERIFSEEKKELIEEISLLRRDILDFLRALRPHGTLLEEFAPIARAIFGSEFSKNVKELSQNYRRLLALAENDKDALEALYDTYNALQSRHSNETIKAFTMLALLTFPLTLIASIFAIDAVARPIVGSRYDFWVILGLMAAVVIAMLLFFKHRRWI